MNPTCCALAWVALAMAACTGAPLERVYVLEAPSAGAETSTREPADGALQLRSIAIPGFLDSTDILVRSGPHQVLASQSGRWGERLSLIVREAIAADLARRLPDHRIEASTAFDAQSRQLDIVITALDAWTDGRCVLAAQWHLHEKGRGPLLLADHATIEIPAAPRFASAGAADPDVVAAMATAVGGLARRLAASVRSAPKAP